MVSDESRWNFSFRKQISTFYSPNSLFAFWRCFRRSRQMCANNWQQQSRTKLRRRNCDLRDFCNFYVEISEHETFAAAFFLFDSFCQLLPPFSRLFRFGLLWPRPMIFLLACLAILTLLLANQSFDSSLSSEVKSFFCRALFILEKWYILPICGSVGFARYRQWWCLLHSF